MSSPAASKRKGAAAEIELLKALLDQGHAAFRVRLAGVNDEGDIHIAHPNGALTVIECKSAARIEMGAWLRELDREVQNVRRHRPGVDVKGRLAVRLRGGRWIDVRPWSL